MRVSVFGLGYVGTVTAACLARDGHHVVGIDVNEEKVRLVGSGQPPMFEPGLEEVLAEAVGSGRLKATLDHQAPVIESDISIICVGTPSGDLGEPDLRALSAVCETIAAAIAAKSDPHVVLVRSTVPPGTTERYADFMKQRTGPSLIHVAFIPEFMREGTAIADYYRPPYTVVGTTDPIAERISRELFSDVDGPLIITATKIAEMVKYVANAWHATKITFANEVGRLAKALGLDGREIMDIITQDKKLNISDAYLRPGLAFGGSCLPKDLSYLLRMVSEFDGADIPMLRAVMASNHYQIELACRMVMELRPARVAVLGLAFKPGTDDLRESPSVLLVKRLIGEGVEVQIYDNGLRNARLMGRNLAYLRANLPHFEALLRSTAEDAVTGADLVVVSHATPEFRRVLADGRVPRILDLAGVLDRQTDGVHYYGIAW